MTVLTMMAVVLQIAIVLQLASGAAYFQPPPPVGGTLGLWLTFLSPIITAIITPFLVLIMAYAAKIMASVKMAQSKNTASIDTLKQESAKTTDLVGGVVQKVNEIHTFTNSALGAAKKSSAVALRLLATITKEPRDIEAASQAETESAQHDASQKIVDAQKLADSLHTTIVTTPKANPS